jgi:hypothetical protein
MLKMPQTNLIVNLPGFTLKKASGYNPLILELHYRKKASCIFCGHKRLRKKSSFIRTVRHESIGHRVTKLHFKAYKFHCSKCLRYFNQRFEGIGKHQRATERLHQQIFSQHTLGVSQKDLSKNFKMGKAPTKLTEPSFVGFVGVPPCDSEKFQSQNPSFTICKCRYQPPFCSCNYMHPNQVTCDQCINFNPDQIGDGAGIGSCKIGIEWTQEINGHMPLYRYAHRHCDQFTKLLK